MANDIRSNFSINKIKQAGLKDQLRGYMFRLKFFDFDNGNSKDSLNIIGSGEDANEIILYTKSISGLPSIGIGKVDDNYYGIKGQIPTTPEFTSNEITVEFRISEKMNPIKTFLDRVLVLTQTQLDFADGGVVTLDDETKDINLNNLLDEYDKLFTNDGNLISDISGSFFFNATVSLMEYNTRIPILTYVLRNAWVSSIKLVDAVGDGKDLITGEMKITFDYAEIYKV